MSAMKNRGLALLGGLLWATLSGGPAALADDTELFVDYASDAAAAPNVLFIFDTSGSMDAVVESQAGYDPSIVYEGACQADRLYWRSGSGDPPGCDTERWIDRAVFTCSAALDAFDSGAGRLTDRFAEYYEDQRRWNNLTQGHIDLPVDCEDDRGHHGDGSSLTHVYAQDGDAESAWSERAEDEINWSGRDTHTVYAANYLNWYYGPTVETTRMQVMRDVATGLVGSINGVNVGLMRYNADQGGRLVHVVADVAEHRIALLDAIAALVPSGRSPMAETLYEAALYFLGYPPHFGDDSIGVAEGAYRTPVEFGCQKNFIVYLSDGEPSEDTDAASLVSALPGFDEISGPACDGTGEGACLHDLARYLHEADLDPNLPGKQNVTTYTIGFTLDLPLMSTTAALGGGQYYRADDTASLSQVLTNIVTSILESQATFTSPAVSVNSFNRTRHLNDLFVTLFQPSDSLHWPGNLKKYRLRAEDATIVDANGSPAVDDSGFFSPEAQSVWSAEPDGRSVTGGGAANRLPAPDVRRVFTYLGAAELASPSNAVRADNGLLTAELLGLGDPDDPSREDVIDFMSGRDVADSNQNNSSADARNQIGDPLHAQPVSLVYGGTPIAPDAEDAIVFMATNDGYLHAVDAASGVEKWAFVPPEFLADQADLLENGAAAAKHYGIDGNLQMQVVADHDGVIDPSSGEKVYLFFGMRRGGSVYYALNVTDPDAPSVMWRLDGIDLPGLGQTWSSPVPTRVRIDGAVQNDEHSVVVFAGGYDETQDNHAATTDDVGNALYIVDSVSGALLWHGGLSDATRNFAAMRYSLPADVKAIDLDGDGFADRIYAADMGGQVWRFDVFNGSPAPSLVTGGVIARLGSAGIDSPTAAETRRFYYPPDVALVGGREASFLHIGIGSGYRAHPNETENQDRFYALRDYAPFQHLTQAQFDARGILTEADLTDVTDDIDAVIAPGSDGWMLRLGVGEKVLAEARTFNNEVYFTTFAPGAAANANDCEPRLGTNRLYVLSLFNGAPVNNLDRSLDEEELTTTDRAQEFRGSIASEVIFLFPAAEDPESCVGDECAPLPVVCVDLFCFPTSFGNNPIRTFWRQESVD